VVEACARGDRRVGADLIIEVGGGGTIEQSMKAIRIGGHVAIVGSWPAWAVRSTQRL